jgi:hypothetical protein
MERQRTHFILPAAAALALLTACPGGGGGAGPADDGGAWMDAALVVVVQDAAAGRETVTLVDEASGTSERMSDEDLTNDVIEVEDSQ